ncbi:YhcH/YjgK/YiaL family protein [Christensenellaceae bacterium OttesenSCG-928-M15]|nr:YhcH/YjgK/YiaL family protein [Christensenellaceae bacterium OttesenSCG-928-M15]
MVFDHIQNRHLYKGLSAGIQTALAYFAQYDAQTHEATPITIAGGFTVNRAAYVTAQKPQPLLEAHQQFIDVMFMAQGEEALYYLPLSQAAMGGYDAAIDASLGALLKNATRFHLSAGQFAIFYPQDAHCPGQLYDMPSDVKKLIAKIPVGQ